MLNQEEINTILARNHADVRLSTDPKNKFSGLLGDEHSFVCLLNGCTFPRKLGQIIDIAKKGSIQPACTKCKRSPFFREEWARFICEQLVGKEFPKQRPDFLRPSPERRPLELDGYCESLKLAFEYQGEQHYKPIGNQTTKDFENQQIRDKEKKRLCKKEGINLIEIRHADESSEIERQIKEQLKSFRIELSVLSPDWSKFPREDARTSEQKAQLHSQMMGYRLEKPQNNTNSDIDYIFYCNNVVGHKNPIIAKMINPGKRPACKACGHISTASSNRKVHTHEELKAAGEKCNPKMLLQEWAGQNEDEEWLFKCASIECNYVWAYAGKAVLDGGKKMANVCIKCKPNGKPRVQFWQVAKVAFELGGKCDYEEKITKDTTLTLHCHNTAHKSFNLRVGQLLDWEMWCPLYPCNLKNGKPSKIPSSQVEAMIDAHFRGLKLLSPPLDGQSSKLDVACTGCGNSILGKTYKKLKTSAKLYCKFCSKELGEGWE
jgi:hypothetical protein